METNISYKGVDLIVVGNYTPAEPMVMYYKDLSGYPGASSEFELTDVFVRDSFISVFNLFSAENLSELEELAINEIEER